jgi:DNA polymerase
MSDSPRDDLAELARLFGAHLDWQRELGVEGVAVNLDERARTAEPARSRPARSLPQPSEPAAVVEPSAAPKFEMPTFLRKGAPGPARVAAPSTPPAAPVVAKVETSAPMPDPVVEPATAMATEKEDGMDAWGPVLEGDARHAALRVLNDRVVECKRCRLHEGRTQTVFARGNPFAPLAFVGEGPGRDEDLQGSPFVGAAGQLLDQIIAAMGMRQDEVYICNVVKCRPPNNRVPAPDEMTLCGGYLVKQLGFVRPQLIVALGKTATSYLLESTEAMNKLRGRWHTWQGLPLLPTWHPAYLLRTPTAKRDTWEDMKLVLSKLGRPVPKRGGGNA